MPIYFAKSLFWQNKSAICQIKTPSQNGIEKGGFLPPSVLFRFSQNLLCLLRKEDKSNRQGGLQILFREQCHCPDRLRQGCKCNRIPCIRNFDFPLLLLCFNCYVVINERKLKKLLVLRFFSLVFLVLQKKVVPLQTEKSAFLYGYMSKRGLKTALFYGLRILGNLIFLKSFGCDFEDVGLSLKLKHRCFSSEWRRCLFWVFISFATRAFSGWEGLKTNEKLKNRTYLICQQFNS